METVNTPPLYIDIQLKKLNSRLRRVKRQIENGIIPTELPEKGNYFVRSSSDSNAGYVVTANTCSCKGFTYKTVAQCKHILLIRMLM